MNSAALRSACRRRRRPLATLGLALGMTLLVPATPAGDLRTFTDTAGRTMVAEILDATETTVRVRREDDRVFELSLDQLSEADRAQIAAWRLKRMLALGGIEIGAHRVRLDADHTQTNSSSRKTEDWCYKISIANRSRVDLAGVTVEYRIFFIDDDVKADRDALPPERKAGRATIGDLARGATAEMQTTVVTLKLVQLKPGHHYPGTSKRKVEDALAGVWVRVFHQGEILQEFASPTTLMKTESW